MSKITTHVLNVSQGRPAAGIAVILEFEGTPGDWNAIGTGVTNDDGRVGDLLDSDTAISSGNYRLRFDTSSYFERNRIESFYPEVVVVFSVRSSDEHYHVPLLLSPFGYSTYRGS